MVILAFLACSTPEVEQLERTALSDLLGIDEPDVTGMSVEPDTGALVLVESDGTLWRVADTVEGLMGPDKIVDSGFWGPVSDVAAMGDGEYALTIPELGLKLDTGDDSLVDWFCYLPGEFGDWEIQTQQTNTLAWDPKTDHLVSQPQTLEDGDPIRSDLAEFDGMEGGDLAWYRLDNDRFYASAIEVVEGGVELVAGPFVYELTYESAHPERVAIVPFTVEGMAVWDGQRVMLDFDAQELVAVDY